MISIIIPVYNASQFLKSSLKSILNQTYSDYEVICVDDGSTDNSLDICREYEKKDKRIHVFSQLNSGVSAARNKGIRVAKGNYLCFLDADDEFSIEYLSLIINYVKPKSATACQFTTDKESLGKGKQTVLIDDLQILINNILEKNHYHLHLGTFLFDANVLSQYNICFTEGCVRNEDIEFICKYACHCDAAEVISYNGYFYRQHENSVMHTLKKSHLTSIEAEKRIADYVQNSGFNVDKERLLAMTIFKLAVLAAREKNKEIYEYLHEKYNISHSAVVLSKSKVKPIYKLLAITYSIMGCKLFYKFI